MALLTSDDGVEPQEGKSGDVVLEQDVRSPAGLIVADLAGTPLLSGVHVVAAVAVVAPGRQLLLAEGPSMAAFALHFGMPAPQREVGHAPMIERLGLPPLCAVTVVTGGSMASAVHVVRGMARDAIRGQILLKEDPLVTAAALLPAMAAREPKSGVPIMIEAETDPALGRVALPTVCPKSPQVDVVQAMAGSTVGSGALEAIRRVTEATVDRPVLAFQRELGRVVVEADIHPAGVRVAARAVLAQGAGVRIVVAVAADAIGRRLPKGRLVGMAVAAGHSPMGPSQGMIGEVVVEACRVQSDDVRVATLVIGVALPTRGIAGPRRAAVEAGVRSAVGSDLLVTLQAECILRRRRKGDMAAAAIALDVGVPLDDLSGHHELLDVDGAGTRRHREDAGRQAGKQHHELASRRHVHPSVHVDGDHVDDRGDEEHDAEREVERVP